MDHEITLKDCVRLVLCKSELFFMDAEGRDVVSSWYPVGKEVASVCSLYFNIPLSYEDDGTINNNKVLENAFGDNR